MDQLKNGNCRPTQFPMSDTPNTLLYLGPSMKPTLKSFDIVHIVPYQNHPKKGDVVAIRRNDIDSLVIHRIIAITPEGIITQGDSNQQRDPETIQRSNILGRVTFVKRSDRIIPICCGFMGYSTFVRCRIISKITGAGKNLMRYPYWHLVSSQAFKRIVSFFLVYRAVQYSGSARTEIQLYLGPLYIGRMRKGRDTWEIRSPFRVLFSDSLVKFPEDSKMNDGEKIERNPPI